MTTSRLGLYNGALLLCGQRAIASLTVNEEARYLLDTVYNNGGIRYCLELGQWLFARRAVRIDYDTSQDPGFGYARAFSKPADWVATSAVCQDGFYKQPLLRYQDEGDYIYADLDTIYARYISDDAGFGGDFSRWPESFREYVEAHFASKVIHSLTGDKEKLQALLGSDLTGQKNGILVSRRKVAKNKTAQAEPTQFAATGSWVRARGGGGGGDRGNTGSLIG